MVVGYDRSECQWKSVCWGCSSYWSSMLMRHHCLNAGPSYCHCSRMLFRSTWLLLPSSFYSRASTSSPVCFVRLWTSTTSPGSLAVLRYLCVCWIYLLIYLMLSFVMTLSDLWLSLYVDCFSVCRILSEFLRRIPMFDERKSQKDLQVEISH